MLFLNPEFILKILGIHLINGFTIAVAWILVFKISILISLFSWVIARRLLRRWARRKDSETYQYLVDLIRTKPKTVSWKDLSLWGRIIHKISIHKGQVYFFRRIILEETRRAATDERKEIYFQIYKKFGFLDEDLRTLKRKLWFKRLSAIIRLETFNNDILIEPFLKAMEDKNDLIALVALRSLSRMNFKDKALRILETLSRRAPARRDVFAEILMNLGAEYRQSLIEVVETCYDPYIASVGISVLGRLQVKEAIPLCLSLLRSSDNDVVAESVAALERIAGNDILPALKPLLNHESDEVRKRVIHALRTFQDNEWRKYAEISLSDPSADVRRQAYELLRHDIRYV